MMSIGALKMPEMAETVPDSARSRAFWGPKAVKYSIIAMPPLRKRQVVRRGDRLARLAHLGGDARQPDVEQEAVGSSIS